MTRRLIAIVLVLTLVCMAVVSGCGSDTPQGTTPAEFYRGKTINLIVSHSAGSSADRVSRVLASYLERDTGANVVVTNRVGAGGLEGINYVYRSEPDGLTLGVVTQGKLVPNKIMDEPAAVYNIEDFSYIMTVGASLYYLLVSPDGPYQSVADLQAGRELRIMVESDKLDDFESAMICKEVARKIEKDLSYPGQIKVTVIRESRAVEYAK